MSDDDDKSKTDKVTKEAAEEPEVQEPKADKPAEDEAAPTDTASAGVDQQGRQLYNVKCSNCGKDTQVPFKPSGDRPVYCRDCYMQKKNS